MADNGDNGGERSGRVVAFDIMTVVATAGLLALGGFLVSVFALDDRQELYLEVGKASLHLLAVGVVGALVKYALDRHAKSGAALEARRR